MKIKVNNLLNDIRPYKEFLTVDELNKALFKLCDNEEIESLGVSDGGYKILSAKFGEGKENALVFGFPHPNEPIGSLSCLSLIELIKNNEELKKKYSWHIVPCADPDGAKLNEEWFKGKFSIKKYTYNFYRPESKKQTDWAFPIKYKDYLFDKPPKNTEALAKLIEKLKPSLVYPLHNAGFSGAYFFVTKNFGEEYYNQIINLCNELKIPLDWGEPDTPFMQPIKKPVYLNFGLEEIYDYFKDSGQNPLQAIDHGTDSIGYALRHNKNVFGIIGEVPYIYDTKIEDRRLSNKSREEILKLKYREYKKIITLIENIIKLPDINKNSIFYELLIDAIEAEKSLRSAGLKNLKNKKYKKKATQAEKFSSEVIWKFDASLIFGECRRLLLDSKKTNKITNAIKNTEKWIDRMIGNVQKKSDYRIIPINKLMKLQIGCLLISLNYLK